jgi:hypothetical protein
VAEERSAASSSIWESFAGGYLVGEAHLAIIEVAERGIRRSVWSGKPFRASSAAEQEQLIIRVAEILARLVAEDYRRAAELGVDLSDGPERVSKRRRRRLRDRAARLYAVRRLTNAEEELTEYHEGFEAYEALAEHNASPPLFSDEFAMQDAHSRYKRAREVRQRLRESLGLQ